MTPSPAMAAALRKTEPFYMVEAALEAVEAYRERWGDHMASYDPAELELLKAAQAGLGLTLAKMQAMSDRLSRPQTEAA